jgi:methionyl aminopeptidase
VKPAFKGYRGYPRSICVSVNEEVVHGIPGPRRLKAGDLVSLDFGVKYDGYYGDAAITVGVGEVGEKARALMAATEKSLYAGIAEVEAGKRLSDISHAVQTVVEGAGFGVIREFVGARHRPVAPRRPADPQFRPARPGADPAGGYDVGH